MNYKQKLQSRTSDKGSTNTPLATGDRLTRASNDTLEKRSLIITKGSEGKTCFYKHLKYKYFMIKTKIKSFKLDLPDLQLLYFHYCTQLFNGWKPCMNKTLAMYKAPTRINAHIQFATVYKRTPPPPPHFNHSPPSPSEENIWKQNKK